MPSANVVAMLPGSAKYNKAAKRGIARYKAAAKIQAKARANKQQTVKKLASKVRRLDLAVKGSVQRNLQETSAIVTPTSAYPLLFDMTDFCYGVTHGAKIYQKNAVTGNVEGAAQFNAFDAGDVPAEKFWNANNLDVCNDPTSGKYFARFAKMRFIISGAPSLDDTRVKISIFKMKRGTIRPQGADTENVLALPDSLDGLRYMVNTNMFNPTYFNVLYEKEIYLNSAGDSPELTTQTNTTGNSRFINLKWNFNNLKINQVTTGQDYAPKNRTYTDPIWCLISTNDLSAAGDAVHVKIRRHVEWRDEFGAANLSS
jgi:hypothetical protein